MLGELAWDHAVRDIPEEGLAVERRATPEECTAVARALDLLSCPGLTARYTMGPRSGGHVHLWGTVEAVVEQRCVITLEPLLSRVAESFRVDFWPEGDLPEPAGGELDFADQTDLEPIVGGRIEVGNVVFQSVANGIDLFPRKPGVAFEPPDPPPASDDGSHPTGPFAALAKMKNKR